MTLTPQSMIKYLLERYTQEELAQLLDISVKSIDNYQKGTNPSKKTKEYIRETYEKVLKNNGKKISSRDTKYKFEAEQDKLISEIVEQLVAVTAKQNILTPIIYELYAAHRNEMLTRVMNELDTVIGNEAKRLLEIIQQKWNLK